MKIFIRGAAVALALSLAGVSGAEAQFGGGGWLPWFQYNGCGGSSFAVCFSADFFQNALTGEIGVDVTNDGPNGTITRLGIVNVASSTAVTEGSVNAGPMGAWSFDANSGLTGAGLPNTIWAYQAPASAMQNGLLDGSSGQFAFAFDPNFDLSSIGFAVHAQGYGTCSSKFGIWNVVNGAPTSTNDVGAANYQSAADCGVNVPEPGSLPLLAVGLVGLGIVVRRRESLVEA